MSRSLCIKLKGYRVIKGRNTCMPNRGRFEARLESNISHVRSPGGDSRHPVFFPHPKKWRMNQHDPCFLRYSFVDVLSSFCTGFSIAKIHGKGRVCESNRAGIVQRFAMSKLHLHTSPDRPDQILISSSGLCSLGWAYAARHGHLLL